MMGKENNNSDSLNFKDFMIGAFFGGIVGASTALLFAPKTGKEMRQNIGDQTISLKEKGTTLAQKAKERSTDIAKTVSDQSNSVVNRVKDFVPRSKSNSDEDTIEAETLREMKTPQTEEETDTSENQK